MKISFLAMALVVSCSFSAQASTFKKPTYFNQLNILMEKGSDACATQTSQSCTQWKTEFHTFLGKYPQVNEDDIQKSLELIYPEGGMAYEYEMAFSTLTFEEMATYYNQRIDKAYRAYIANSKSEDYQPQVADIYQKALGQLKIMQSTFPNYAKSQCTVAKSTWGIGSGSNGTYWECRNELAESYYKRMRSTWSEFSGE